MAQRHGVDCRGLALLAVCAGLACGPTVTRLDDTTPVDLSGLWNDTDSRLVSEEMVRDVLGRPWLEQFVERNGRRPVILFDGVENRTAEHLPQETFLNAIQRAVLNSGRVSFVADPGERERLRAERADQAANASPTTASPAGAELGADFLLGGMIAYIEDAGAGKQLRVYQVNLTLLSLRDNQMVWSGQKVIRKLIGRSRAKP